LLFNNSPANSRSNEAAIRGVSFEATGRGRRGWGLIFIWHGYEFGGRGRNDFDQLTAKEFGIFVEDKWELLGGCGAAEFLDGSTTTDTFEGGMAKTGLYSWRSTVFLKKRGWISL
jgi:hypothetical protein